MTVRFSNQLVAELIQPFWAAWQAGEFMTDASAVAGTYRQRGLAWVRQAGGVRPRRGRDLQGRYLSFGEREEIALGRAAGESIRSISRRLGRSPSTISRELARNGDGKGAYRATTAHPLAYERASRPKAARLVTNVVLRARVELDLRKKYSPEQIAGRLRDDYPDDPEMWVSTETIYQSLYVQSRGALRRDLAKCLRTGRGLRQPNRQGAQRKSRVLPDMINIAERRLRPMTVRRLGRGGGSNHRQGQRQRDRHPGGTHHGLHDAGAPARGLQTCTGRAGPGREDPNVACVAARVAGLGSGRRDA